MSLLFKASVNAGHLETQRVVYQPVLDRAVDVLRFIVLEIKTACS